MIPITQLASGINGQNYNLDNVAQDVWLIDVFPGTAVTLNITRNGNQ